MVEGKKNLPGEADIQKIKRYIERTHIPKRVLQYRNASVKDLRAMMDFSDSVGVSDALILSFYYGQAICYRAAKEEFRRGKAN